MKNALAVIAWFIILIVAFTNALGAKTIGDQIGDVTNNTTTADRIPATEIASFHTYLNEEIKAHTQHNSLVDKKASLKIIDSPHTTYLRKAWTLCTSEHPCTETMQKILSYLPYSVPAVPANQKDTDHSNRVMLASWEDYCSNIGQNNVACLPFDEPVYFKAIDNGQYEIYLRENN